jgi:mitochondrial fission protein ELM1
MMRTIICIIQVSVHALRTALAHRTSATSLAYRFLIQYLQKELPSNPVDISGVLSAKQIPVVAAGLTGTVAWLRHSSWDCSSVVVLDTPKLQLNVFDLIILSSGTEGVL